MKILLVSTNQFGYLIDYHRYYTYLKNRNHSVTYITFEYKRPKITPDNPDVIYVSRKGNKFSRLFRLIRTIIRHERQNNYDRILIHYFLFISSLVLFIRNSKMALDVRTVSIYSKKYQRQFFDFMILFASKVFKNVSILNDFSAKHIGITNYKLLPLGGAYFSSDPGNDPEEYRHLFTNDDFIFLYVGTLHKRNIIECVKGFHSYLQQHPGAKARFIIIGQAINNELNEINEYITTHKLQPWIHIMGYIPQHRLSVFFRNADCGVTFIPLTKFFSMQPSTKTYEYLINGIPVIATSTWDNVKLLASTDVPSGVIIKDTADAFEQAVSKMLDEGTVYNKEAIALEFQKYEWDNLLNQHLEDVLNIQENNKKQMCLNLK